MNRKTLIVLIILVILNAQAYAANVKPPGLFEADFGSIQAAEPINRILSFSIPVNLANPSGIFIETPGLTNYQNNKRIPIERFTLLLNNKMMVMNTSRLEVELGAGFNNKQIDIKFNLELKPIDHPGIYQGVFRFRFWKTEQNRIQWSEPIQMTFKVQIEPWIRIKTDTPYIKIQPEMVRDNVILKNMESLRIQIASNSNWRLGVNIISNNTNTPITKKDVALLIKVAGDFQQYQGASQINTITREGKKVVAIGTSTVSGSDYWCNIPVDLYLIDYTKYPTGSYYFQINFFGEVF